MIKRMHLLLGCLVAVCGFLLSGCAIESQPPAILYDLGPPSLVPTEKALPSDMPVLSVSRVTASDWLSSSMMYYRLEQVNDQQTRFYTLSRWNMPPSNLFQNRLKSRIVSAGGEISVGRVQGERLRLVIYVEDFSQYFSDASHSEARIVLRVSILGKKGMIAQKRFLQTVPSKTPDAAGGAQALSVATDDVITEILAWIVSNYQKDEVQ